MNNTSKEIPQIGHGLMVKISKLIDIVKIIVT